MAEPLAVRPQLARRSAPPYQPLQVHERVFTATQCEQIVELGLALPSTTAALEGEDGVATSDVQLRDARTAWIPPGPSTDWIYRKLATVAQRANRTYGFDLTGFDEDLQFTCYERPGSFYTWHQDGLDASVALRKLSLVVQLSDPADYAGAELELFALHDPAAEQTREVGEPAGVETPTERRQGSVLVFPSFEFHRVLPLSSGVRYSLVSWVSGPPFR